MKASRSRRSSASARAGPSLFFSWVWKCQLQSPASSHICVNLWLCSSAVPLHLKTENCTLCPFLRLPACSAILPENLLTEARIRMVWNGVRYCGQYRAFSQLPHHLSFSAWRIQAARRLWTHSAVRNVMT